MRRIWVAVALLLICGVLSVIEYVTIHNNCDYLTSSLNKAEEYISIKEYKKAVSFLEKTQQEWINSEKKLNIFLLHDETESISESLSKLKESAQEENTTKYLTDSKKIKRQLLRLKQSELPDFENIL